MHPSLEQRFPRKLAALSATARAPPDRVALPQRHAHWQAGLPHPRRRWLPRRKASPPSQPPEYSATLRKPREGWRPKRPSGKTAIQLHPGGRLPVLATMHPRGLSAFRTPLPIFRPDFDIKSVSTTKNRISFGSTTAPAIRDVINQGLLGYLIPIFQSAVVETAHVRFRAKSIGRADQNAGDRTGRSVEPNEVRGGATRFGPSLARKPRRARLPCGRASAPPRTCNP